MPLDPNEAPTGYRAVEGTGGCNGCAFIADASCRKDNTSVVFVPIVQHVAPTAQQLIDLLNEVDVVPGTDWSDRRTRLIETLKSWT